MVKQQSISKLFFDGRKNMKITMGSLAERSGISASTIYRIESGNFTANNPRSKKTLMKIAKVLGVDIPKTRKEKEKQEKICQEKKLPPIDLPTKVFVVVNRESSENLQLVVIDKRDQAEAWEEYLADTHQHNFTIMEREVRSSLPEIFMMAQKIGEEVEEVIKAHFGTSYLSDPTVKSLKEDLTARVSKGMQTVIHRFTKKEKSS